MDRPMTQRHAHAFLRNVKPIWAGSRGSRGRHTMKKKTTRQIMANGMGVQIWAPIVQINPNGRITQLDWLNCFEC